MKATVVSKRRRSVSLLCALPLLLISGADVMRAQAVFTAGTITSVGGAFPPGTINVQGSNASLSGTEIGGSLALLAVTSTIQTVTFNPGVSANVTGPFINFIYNGTPYNCLTISLNFSAAPVTVPNTAAPFIAQGGSYSAQVSNVPFSMTGTVAVLNQSTCSGPALFTVPISGSGLYSANTTGTRTAGPGGIPSGNVTYQFLPASVFSTDTTTQGAWNGKYGADGFQIANGASSLPSYATVNFTGASTYTWASRTTDPRALQNGAGATLGIASSYDANSFSINVNLMDGLTHRVALYLLDWDTTTRAETITITNLSTNTVYDTETLSNFHNGVYAIWNLQGNVSIKVTSIGGVNAVVSGIFFGPGGNPSAAPAGPPSVATYQGLDTSTQGSWTGIYGAKGYLIANDASSVAPSYASTNVSGDFTYTWAGQTTDPRALQSSSGATNRIASAYTQYAGSSFTINVNISDNNYHRVSLYLLDWDSSARTETITIRDLSTNTVLDTETFSSFHGGEYATWNLYGNVVITVTPGGYSSPVVSGIFFNN